MHEEDPEVRAGATRASDPTQVHLRVAAVAAEVATVRHAVDRSAEAHGIGRAARNDIALAVSEACTNVVMHAYRDVATPGPLGVQAFGDKRRFVVVVRDEGRGMTPRTDSPGLGLGLGLIGSLAQGVEIGSNDPVGAMVTMLFDAPAAASPSDPTTLSSAEREWIRRQGRMSRAIEASQR